MNKDIARWLFQTNAIKVCPENKPFWYTSGRIGPFYVNTHYLYGSEKKANALLQQIDALVLEPGLCSSELEALVLQNLSTDEVFSGVIEALVAKVQEELDINEIDGISGGERRDWFFSLAVAYRLGKKHLTIFKDKKALLYSGRGIAKSENHALPTFPFCEEATSKNVGGMKFLHLADLITTASSYERAWVPAIRSLGAEMPWSLVVVDRLQSGRDCLAAQNVISLALAEVNEQLFEEAVDAGVLNISSLPMLRDYIKDPEGSMGAFVKEHPEFIEQALKGDEKTAARARLCIQSGHYVDSISMS